MYASIHKKMIQSPSKELIGYPISSLSLTTVELGEMFLWIPCPEHININNFQEWAYNHEIHEFVHIINILKNKQNRLPITIL